MSPRVLAHILAPAAALLMLATPASAQEPGVTIDPGGPSSKEYAIPLESARQNAAGTGSTAPPDSRTAPLFGVGVKAKSANKTASHRRPKRSVSATAKTGSRTAPDVKVVSASTPSGGFGTPATIGGLTLSVLLLGGVLGSIARRRRVP